MAQGTPSRRPIVVATSLALAIAMLGGLATRVGPWYEGLDKPALNPPDWVFAPAWTLIYALSVAAAVIGWHAAGTRARRTWLLSLFFVNAVFNILWSVLFFTFQRPDWALVEVAGLWGSVLALIVFLQGFTGRGAVCLVPYLLWVSFAAWLNYQIVVLNGPFG